ncbi:centrosomal protein of 112 kDa [Polymixia lowei]
MSKHEDSWEKLDSDFDLYLGDMKPYVLKLPNKTERQRCAMWIKKLCDPAMCGSGLGGRKNRNMYARLLLHMLKRGVLEGPFSSKPEPGSLKTLPTYMSIYFDEPLGGGPMERSCAALPDWVSGELGGHSCDTWASSLLKDRTSSSPTAAHLRRRLYEEKTPSRPMASSPIKPSARDDTRTVAGGMRSETSADDSDLEARLNSWNLGIENPRYLREKPIPLSPIFKSSLGRNSTLADEQGPLLIQNKEIEMKIKVVEAKHQEEKLKMQQRHDTDVQKILDRKNCEIEELKTAYRAKQKESEDTARKLERKVQSILRESQVIRESKEKQIVELKKMSDQSADSLKNEWETKLHAAVSGMEQEKFELQKKHTENIQELLEDTNRRLAKMEAEYSAQTQAAETTLRELEVRVKQQSAEVEKGIALRQKVTQEKAQLEIHIAAIGAELHEANGRSMSLLKEKEQQGEQHEQTLRQLQAKHETDISHFQQQHALSAAKASEVMEDLERIAAQLRQQLQDSEYQRQKQLRDQDTKFQQEKDELQINCEKKVLAIHTEAEKERAEAKRKMAKLEDALRETESQLDRARESQRQQAQQADVALEQFKKQVELSSEKAYADMKLQMKKVEEDLIRSKSLREKQAKEFSQQLDTLRHKYEQQMAEQRVQQEQERTRLQQQHSAERDSLVQERQREVGSLERQARAALQQHQQHTQEWRKRDAQTISDLEDQVAGLREELQAAHAQRKQQLAEVSLLREEERQRATQDQDASLARLRTEMERIHGDLERRHQQEKDSAQERSNSRLKQIEKEFGQKLAKSAQLIAELQTSACDSKEEAVRVQQALERQLGEANARWDQERRTLTRHADQASKALQEKVESLQRQLYSSEKKLISKELETQEQVTAVRQECELKIKGLMPADLRQELEDTIASLKAQVRTRIRPTRRDRHGNYRDGPRNKHADVFVLVGLGVRVSPVASSWGRDGDTPPAESSGFNLGSRNIYIHHHASPKSKEQIEREAALRVQGLCPGGGECQPCPPYQRSRSLGREMCGAASADSNVGRSSSLSRRLCRAGAEDGVAEGCLEESAPLQLPTDTADRSQNVWQWILESERQGRHKLTGDTQSTKKSFGGGSSAQTHTWGGGGSCGHLRSHQPAHPFIQDPAMPPLPPPNTLAQLEEACRRLEEVSTKAPKQQRHSTSGLQREKSHLVPVQSGGGVPSPLANPGPAGPLAAGPGLQSEETKECKKGSGSHGLCGGETVVTYFFCGEEIPYRRTMKSHSLTLGHFKEQLRKKGSYRYYFKKASDEFDCGAVFEEVSDECSLLPTYEGKILGKVERME